MDDRFLAHTDLVLELGSDMHLLDFTSTSIYTCSTMDIYILNIDDDDLDRIQDQGFSAKKRVVHSEELGKNICQSAAHAITILLLSNIFWFSQQGYLSQRFECNRRRDGPKRRDPLNRECKYV